MNKILIFEFSDFFHLVLKALILLTIARHFRPLSSECSLAYTTYLRHRTSVYNHYHYVHLPGPMALTPVAECLAVELSVPALIT